MSPHQSKNMDVIKIAYMQHTSEEMLHKLIFQINTSNTCPISNIFIHSSNICHQTSKSSEIGPNFACFCP